MPADTWALPVASSVTVLTVTSCPSAAAEPLNSCSSASDPPVNPTRAVVVRPTRSEATTLPMATRATMTTVPPVNTRERRRTRISRRATRKAVGHAAEGRLVGAVTRLFLRRAPSPEATRHAGRDKGVRGQTTARGSRAHDRLGVAGSLAWVTRAGE